MKYGVYWFRFKQSNERILCTSLTYKKEQQADHAYQRSYIKKNAMRAILWVQVITLYNQPLKQG